jgi:hypothetical protein
MSDKLQLVALSATTNKKLSDKRLSVKTRSAKKLECVSLKKP